MKPLVMLGLLPILGYTTVVLVKRHGWRGAGLANGSWFVYSQLINYWL